MALGWVAAGSLAGGLLGAYGSTQAAGQQAGALNNATQAQLQMFNQLNNQQEPYRQAGYAGLSRLGQLLGTSPQTYGASTAYNGQTPLSRDQFDTQAYLANNPDVAANAMWKDDPYGHYLQEGTQGGKYRTAYQLDTTPAAGQAGDSSYGSLLRPFSAADLNSNLAPNYQFQLQQGLGATQNMLNASGGNMSGNTLRAINDYAQGTAAGAYQQAYENYNTNQANIYNRLASIAGLGQTANSQSAQTGTSLGQGAAGTLAGAGAATGAGTVGAANAIGQGLSNAGTWYGLSKIAGFGGLGSQSQQIS